VNDPLFTPSAQARPALQVVLCAWHTNNHLLAALQFQPHFVHVHTAR